MQKHHHWELVTKDSSVESVKSVVKQVLRNGKEFIMNEGKGVFGRQLRVDGYLVQVVYNLSKEGLLLISDGYVALNHG
ncbi:polymorphic toxin type 35 domain-containing protein [Lacticaseibacillus absianus]|uniref:polymorphic toxin type 35 domain-containing protein n=1 Tax=Lacticaseibacillus absianus TaxID=2729623 RepID=UPI003CCCA248